MKYYISKISPLIFLFLAGISTGLSFAPIYFTPGIFGISYLLYRLSKIEDLNSAFKEGYIFGVGFFLSILYWIAFGVSVYIDEFWWAIPFALLGLPCFLALFIAFVSLATAIYKIKFSSYKFYKIFNLHIAFCSFWLIYELVSESFLTGLPWALLGYSLSFSLTLIQTSSIFGIFGLSAISIYIASSFYSKDDLTIRILAMGLIIGTMFFWGQNRLSSNPTEYTQTKARIVQASIPQSDKWKTSDIWDNIDKHLDLSKSDIQSHCQERQRCGNSEMPEHTQNAQQASQVTTAYSTIPPSLPDLIIWPEAALVIPYYYSYDLMDEILHILNHGNGNNMPRLLITGAATDNKKAYGAEDFEIYSSMIGFSNNAFINETTANNDLSDKELLPNDDSRDNSSNDPRDDLGAPNGQNTNQVKNITSNKIYEDENGDSLYLAFEYHKSHLVPFGEYMPLGSILPIKKLTPGLVDYTEGNFELVKLSDNSNGQPHNKFGITLQPQICYESIFSSQMNRSNEDVDLIINITNDAWYGNSSGPYQHFEIARIRAIENGLPMIRAANNGISAFIDPLGRVISKLKLNDVGVLDSFIPKKLNETTYFSIYKKTTLFLLLLIAMIPYIATAFYKRESRKR